LRQTDAKDLGFSLFGRFQVRLSSGVFQMRTPRPPPSPRKSVGTSRNACSLHAPPPHPLSTDTKCFWEIRQKYRHFLSSVRHYGSFLKGYQWGAEMMESFLK
jgi:hypothetical protein